MLCWAALSAVLFGGCASLEEKPPSAQALPPLPSKKTLRVGQYIFVTDMDLKPDNSPFWKQLEGLQEHVSDELRGPPCPIPVYIYLFNDRPRYDQYMHAHFRNLPSRRAFFMARTDERFGDQLVVYTYWGDRVQEDLRHELTHALLHGVLKDVPMWLDEGLAEYFEVPPQWQGLNHQHLRALRSQPGIPWTPNLARLEKLTLVKDMSPADYRESWAWVHFMLKTPEARIVLTEYLMQLRTSKDPGPFEPRLAAVIPSPETELRAHLARIESSTRDLQAFP